MSKWKMWTAVCLVFASGIITGTAVTGLYVKNRIEGIFHEGPRAVKKIVVKKLSRDLSLTKYQQTEIERIVGETQARLQQLRLEHQPETDRIIDSGLEHVKAVLSREQQQKMQALYEQARKRWRIPEKGN